jgi:hypothetical protein
MARFWLTFEIASNDPAQKRNGTVPLDLLTGTGRAPKFERDRSAER